jgi:diphosphomevalonate decarboxylase
MSAFETTWQAPSNIALVKYWGKHGNQLPNNPSLSITMRQAVTTTHFRAEPIPPDTREATSVSLEYRFEGERVASFENRVKGFLEKLLPELPFLAEYKFKAESSNTFPHSAGIASSASSMATLALCLAELEQKHTRGSLNGEQFLQRASVLARLGSGSASRSIYGGWVSWGASGSIPGSSDEFASPLSTPVHPMFQQPGVAIMVVSSAQKTVSSSSGHTLMNSHPFATARYQQAHDHLSQLLKAIAEGDFETFSGIVENEALTLHSLLMTSSPDGMLMKSSSLKIIEEVRAFRKATGTPVCFTMDAGPNVLLIYPHEHRDAVKTLIDDKLTAICENGRWMDDGMGPGPVQMHDGTDARAL